MFRTKNDPTRIHGAVAVVALLFGCDHPDVNATPACPCSISRCRAVLVYCWED